MFAKASQDSHAAAVMVVERKHVLYNQTVDRVIFALQVLNAGFKLTAHNKVLVGACVNSRFVVESLFSPTFACASYFALLVSKSELTMPFGVQVRRLHGLYVQHADRFCVCFRIRRMHWLL